MPSISAQTYAFKLQTMSFRKTRGTFSKLPFRKVSLNVGKNYLLPRPPPSHCMKAITILHQQYSKDTNLRKKKKKSPELNTFSFKKAYYTMNFYLGTTYLHGLIAGALQTYRGVFIAHKTLKTVKCYVMWKISCKKPNFCLLVKLWKALRLWPASPA